MKEDHSIKTIRDPKETLRDRQVESLIFTPDGKYIICTPKYNFIEIWETESGNIFKKIQVNKALNGTVKSVQITPNGQYIITGSRNGKLKVFDFFSEELVWEFKTLGSLNKVALSLDGRYIITSTIKYNRINIFDFPTRENIYRFKVGRIFPISITPDNKYFFISGQTKKIEMWDLLNKAEVRTMTTKKMGFIYSLAANLNYVVSGSFNKLIRVWDFSSGKLINTIEGHTGWVNSVIISPDDKYILSGSLDKTIKIWELETGRLVHTLSGHIGSVQSLALSPDGKYIASGSSDRTIKLWNMI